MTLTEWLKERHGEIMAREERALEALNNSNVEEYADFMREKARELAALAAAAAPYLKELSARKRFDVGDRLRQFSENAQMALDLDSVFYMSALLYPDNHKKGEPDNLALFIEELKK